MKKTIQKSPVVLVVDDELGIGNVLRIKLRISGYDSLVTRSGVEAVEIVRKQNPDIVVLDMLMPEMSGVEVLKEIRRFSPVPVIAFTAKADAIEPALKNGANDAILKPFDPNELIAKIALLLKKATS